MTETAFLNGKVILHHGDNRDVLRGIADNSLDSIVTDPPYALVSIVKRFGGENAAPAKEGKTGAYARASKGFMGKSWDTGEVAFATEFWAEIYRVLKPGGHVVAFSGTRTVHRMVCAIEDAGFEIRDMLAWLYGTGFPKSHDVSKGIDKKLGGVREKIRHTPRADTSGTMAGSSDTRPWIEKSREVGYHEVDGNTPATPAALEWQGWGTALKPALEPICLARKPLSEGTVAANVLEHGTGAININSTRIGTTGGTARSHQTNTIGVDYGNGSGWTTGHEVVELDKGRWPANVVHDGSDEVVGMFPTTTSGKLQTHHKLAESENGSMSGKNYSRSPRQDMGGDSGSAARFFYSAKANKRDRAESKHPTVKPVALMRWLSRLVTPPGGTLLDPFAGSGTTGEAAYLEGFNAILIEREEEYVGDIARRLSSIVPEPANDNEPDSQMGLFASNDNTAASQEAA